MIFQQNKLQDLILHHWRNRLMVKMLVYNTVEKCIIQ